MEKRGFVFLFICLLVIKIVISNPLTVVSNKSGEQQVKEALKKAEQEAEKAAKDNKTKEPSENDDRSLQTTKTEMPESSNDNNDEQANKRMKAMAAKLNNLVLKFQRKVMANKLHNALQRRVALVKAGKKALQAGKEAPGTLKSSTMDLNGLDMGIMRTFLQTQRMLNSKNGMTFGNSLASPNNGYKEDTKLEDRLALEAEEEKKVKDGETYDDDGGYGDSMKNYAGTTSLSPKEQASQEMQRYNALISSESSRELSQIQDEITKATQTSMGKVSVQGENPTAPFEQSQPKELSLGSLGNLGGLGGASFAGFGNNAGIGSLDGGLSTGSLSSTPGLSGISLGGQSESTTETSQDPSLAGAIDVNPMEGAQNGDQQLAGLQGAGAEIQGQNGDGNQVFGGEQAQMQTAFNKKSKISKQTTREEKKQKGHHGRKRHEKKGH